jgi:hypothetical protein
LLEVTVEVVGEQLSRGHDASVFGIIIGDVLALIEVLVDVGVFENDLVELQLSCSDTGIECPQENTQRPSNHDETEGGNEKLQNPERDRCGGNSFSSKEYGRTSREAKW